MLIIILVIYLNMAGDNQVTDSVPIRPSGVRQACSEAEVR